MKTFNILLALRIKFTNALLKTYFGLYRRTFAQCNGIFLSPPYFIRGHRYIRIGRNFVAGRGLRLEVLDKYNGIQFAPELRIGNRVSINDYVHIACINKISIGNNVLMASKIFISDHNHGYYSSLKEHLHESPDIPPIDRLLSQHDSVTIEDNVWVGEFVSILPGVTIGKGSVIACNSVVTRDIPPYSIAAGIPAKPIKTYDFDRGYWKAIGN
jgi:lipopolysaccharide O-acetyltransferase